MAWSAQQKKLDAKSKGMESVNSLKFSTWTPMNHSPTNDKVFEERRALVGKWWEKWSDSQRKRVLQDIIHKSSKNLLEFGIKVTGDVLPFQKHDFTRVLPRCLAIYILSFLDPRSLCRCSQVSWYWKYLSELDQVWMSKCLKLGWYLTFSPSPYETAIWKRLYLENVREINLLGPKKKKGGGSSGSAITNGHTDTDSRTKHHIDFEKMSRKPPRSKTKTGPPLELPPWKGSDPVVKDTMRYNYLDNDDEIINARSKRVQRMYEMKGGSTSDLMDNTDSSLNSKKISSTMMNYKLKKAKSASNLNQRNERPEWAKHKAGDSYVNVSSTFDTSSGRPAPVQKPPSAVRSSAVRNERDVHSSKSFTSQPWRQPDPYYSDDD
ncbi:F-box only protein 16-like [Glandiceps talaboti]